MRSLPDWFGIESAIRQYLGDIESRPTFVGIWGEQITGFVVINIHNRYTAEIHIMGVLPQYHGRGVGRALVNYTESFCRLRGLEYLLVKTLGPSKQNKYYQRTRNFYLACGFRPLEELDGIWSDNPCLLMVKRL